MIESFADERNTLHCALSTYPLSTHVDSDCAIGDAQLNATNTTTSSASAICFSKLILAIIVHRFAVDRIRRAEALFIAHSEPTQCVTLIWVNNRSLKDGTVTALVIKCEFTQIVGRLNRILFE